MIDFSLEDGVALVRLSGTPAGCTLLAEFYVVMLEGQVVPGRRFKSYTKAFGYLEKRMALRQRRRAAHFAPLG
jgi:hypothetical protein